MSKRAYVTTASEGRGPRYTTATTTFQVAEDIMPIAELKARLSETIRALDGRPRPLVITLNGKPAAVLMSAREFDRMRYERQVVKSIAEGLADDAAGRTITDAEVGRMIEEEFGPEHPPNKKRR